jgi:hypothetical protein
VAEDKRLVNDERADAAHFVVVDVRAADAYGPDLDQDLLWSRFGDGDVL